MYNVEIKKFQLAVCQFRTYW